MWEWMKYLYLALRLATLFENLNKIKARDAMTSAASYQPAAAALMSDPGIKKWIGRLSADEQARFTESLPLFIWGLDSLSE